ncbi:MAG: type II secretion system F family protein [Pseudomonadota bacterium]
MNFNYRAISPEGRMVQGLIQANSAEDLEQRLRRMDLDLVNYQAQKGRAGKASAKVVERRELITFCIYMEQLMRAGVPLLDALHDLQESVEQNFREVIASMVEDVENGQQLSAAMQRYPRVFDNVFVSLVRAGEASGTLEQVFKHLADSIKWQDELVSHTKKLLMYPSFVFAAITGLVFFMMVYLVPQLVEFIKSTGQELPMQTRALLATSDFFTTYWYIILGTPIAVWMFFKIGSRFSYQIHFRADSIALNSWVIGPILKKIILARFASFFGLLYASGVTILDSLNIVKSVSNNLVIESAIEQVSERIAEGASITNSFSESGLFPPLIVRMVSVGEASGRLDEAMENVSYFYNRDVQDSIDKLQAAIGPVLTLLLGGLMAWIIFSVFGPIYDIIADFGGAG